MRFNLFLQGCVWLLSLNFLSAKLLASALDSMEAIQRKTYALAHQAALEDNHAGVLKAWLVQQALIKQGYPLHDPLPFYRLIWLSLERQHLCPDLAPEPDDLGLWSITFYNFAVKSYRASQHDLDNLASPVAGQQSVRVIDLESSLSLAEWESLKIFRGPCRFLDRLQVRDKSLPAKARKLVLLESLLQQIQRHLSPQVEGRALIRARLEQVQLALARHLKKPPPSLPTNSLDGLTAEDWARLDLPTAAELFPVWRQAHTEEAGRALALAVIDQLILMSAGDRLSFWISQAAPPEKAQHRHEVWGGERGSALLASSKFSERSIIALYRGVQQLENNQLEDAFRSFALARKFAPESRKRKDLEWHLANWTKYAAIRYQVTDDLLRYLVAYLEADELREILKQMLWQAAMHGDPAMPQLFKLPQLPRDLRQHKNYFEALSRGRLEAERASKGAERGHFLRFVREYSRQLEWVSFPVLQKQQVTLARLEQDLRHDTDPQWKLLRSETLEQMARLTQGLRTRDVAAQGQRDKQSAPQALGSTVLPPELPGLWPFDSNIDLTADLQIIGLTLATDRDGRDVWRVHHPQDGGAP